MQADVAVVGTGAAGTAAALQLTRHGASVVIVDRGIQRPLLGESLPPIATPFLQDLGLWDGFLAGGHRPSYGNRSTWGSSRTSDADFIRSPYGRGWHLHRPCFDRGLQQALEEEHIPVLSSSRVLACDRGAGKRWRLTISRGAVCEGIDIDFVVDASGRSRQIARLLGADRLVYDRLVGMIGILQPGAGADDPTGVTEIEAVQDGWWYASAIPDGRLVAGYMTDADSETSTRARTSEGWTGLIEETAHLRERIALHGYTLHGSIRRVSAGSSQLVRTVHDGWCAVGDAAAAYDPLSSQGIVSALDTGRRAADAVISSRLAAYDEYVQEVYARYLATWLRYYALERRWSEDEFWWRRHEALVELLTG